MSYNGSGTFNINSAGQPVVSGTTITSTAFNLLTADLGTGLSTAICKDGQTTTTARINFAVGIGVTTDMTTPSTSFALINATATTVNFAGAATTFNMGANSGTLTVGNPTIVGTQTTQALWNTVATTINFAGAATTMNIGAATSQITVTGQSLTLTGANSTNNTSLTVSNSSNAAAASNSFVDIAVGGTTSTGDPHLRLTIPGGTSWYEGVDNSDSDKWKLGTGTAVGTNTIVTVSTTALTLSSGVNAILAAGQALYLDGGTDSRLIESVNDQVDLYAGTSRSIRATVNGIEIKSDVALSAGGTGALTLLISSAGGGSFGFYCGSGAPTVSAAKGSFYLRSDGSGTTDRAYINTNGATTWTAITTVA